jgi:hypothetical protein
LSTSIPAAALKQHVIALGKTGSGKSSKLRLQVEYLLDRQMPLTIVDPKGDWWGLKSSADGRHAGYPLVVFGGEHADVPINEHSGAHVAELVATGNRPALIDLGGWMVGERTRFFIGYASTLFKLSRGERHLVLPECHNFAPQGKILDPDAGKMLHWANRLASEGRGRGITILADSQRPQKVHKDFLTCCETLIACKVIHKLDRDAIKDWIDGCADAAKGREVIAGLAQLKKPEAWVWSPEIDFGPQLVTFPMFRTFDSFTPLRSEDDMPVGWADVDLDDVKAKMATVVATAAANDPKALKAQIAELKEQLRGAGDNDTKAYAARNEGFQEGKAVGDREGYTRGLEEGRTSIGAIAMSVGHSTAVIRKELDSLLEHVDQLQRGLPTMSVHPQRDRDPATSRALEQMGSAVARSLKEPAAGAQGRAASQMSAGVATAGPNVGAGSSSVQKAMPRAMLTALAQHRNGLTKGQVRIHTGYRDSGPVSSCFADLASNGWTEMRGGLLFITPAGQKALGSFEPLPRGHALREHLLNGGSRLSTMEKALLSKLFDAYPMSISKGKVRELAGYADSGPVSSAFAKLTALGYAVKAGRELKAAEELFE